METLFSYSGTSMYFDRLAGRHLEVDELTGAVVAAGERHNVLIPPNRAFLLLLRAVSDAAGSGSRPAGSTIRAACCCSAEALSGGLDARGFVRQSGENLFPLPAAQASAFRGLRNRAQAQASGNTSADAPEPGGFAVYGGTYR